MLPRQLSMVGVGVKLRTRVAVCVKVGVMVGVAVRVGWSVVVGVSVLVGLGPVAVALGVAVSVPVAVIVGDAVAVWVGTPHRQAGVQGEVSAPFAKAAQRASQLALQHDSSSWHTQSRHAVLSQFGPP
jgi:hypothetical protein